MNEYVRHIHDYIQKQIVLADQKAAFIVVLTGGLIAYLFNGEFHRLWFLPMNPIGFVDALSFFAFYFLAVGTIYGVLTVWPRLKRSQANGELLISFIAIAKYPSSEKYHARFSLLNEFDLQGELLKHVWDLAVNVCTPKFQCQEIAFWSTALGLALAVVVLLAH